MQRLFDQKLVAMNKRKITPIKRRTTRHKHSSVTYLDEEWIKLHFWNLVVRVDSINRLFGPVNLFVRAYKLHVRTNVKLLIISEMISPPGHLAEIISMVLTPLRMNVSQDYILIMEEPLRGVGDRYSPYIEFELPVTRELDWVQSILDFNGCFVWFNSSQ